MAERSKAAVLKTVDVRASWGSNPYSSATYVSSNAHFFIWIGISQTSCLSNDLRHQRTPGYSGPRQLSLPPEVYSFYSHRRIPILPPKCSTRYLVLFCPHFGICRFSSADNFRCLLSHFTAGNPTRQTGRVPVLAQPIHPRYPTIVA